MKQNSLASGRMTMHKNLIVKCQNLNYNAYCICIQKKKKNDNKEGKRMTSFTPPLFSITVM